MTLTATPRLALPFLQAGQALKNITHNEALQRLDASHYLSCSDMAANDLPDEPAANRAVIISETPAASISDRAGQIAVFIANSWIWFTPTSGWTIWDEAAATLRIFNGESWIGPSPEIRPESLPRLGLNATATDTQRLSVSSETSLFNHDGGSHRLNLNRSDNSETASLIFQTGFMGEAELGLTGTGGFSLKTSGDGTTFSNRLTANDTYPGIQSPAYGSRHVSVADAAAVFVETPATGGLIAFTNVSDIGRPQVAYSGLFAYDTGVTPTLISLAKTPFVENHITSPLDGTVSQSGNIGISAGAGGIYLENRSSNTKDFSLIFLC